MLRSLIIIVLTAPLLCALIGAGPGTDEQQSNDPSEYIQDWFNKNEPCSVHLLMFVSSAAN